MDPQGRLIACDQNGGLYRIDVSGEQAQVEKLEIDFIGAQGSSCAFGSLYANVNYRDKEHGDSLSGVWRLTDTNGDDQYDKKEHLLPLNGGSEHGPHAMILTPDGKRIILRGQQHHLPENLARSRVPMNWDEDHLLGRMPDARGHNAGRMAPGGFILSMDPNAEDLELIATGFRNEYDIALNREGELFAYDADMEWDDWHSCTGRRESITSSVVPSSVGVTGLENGLRITPTRGVRAVDIGPGSPTGICFGYGTHFSPKYQDALFICDWSYGNIHAVFLTPDGSTYRGTYETFATADRFR